MGNIQNNIDNMGRMSGAICKYISQFSMIPFFGGDMVFSCWFPSQYHKNGVPKKDAPIEWVE